jgi:xylulokinase
MSPRPNGPHAYRRMYGQFRAAEDALAPVSRALAGIHMG